MAITQITKPYTFTNNTETADATKVNADFDTAYSGVNTCIAALNLGAGTTPSLKDRLAITLNEDGTARSGITAGGEWINPALSPTYASASTFTVAGDRTDIYLANRMLKIVLAGGTYYTPVVSSSYSVGTGLTTITTAAILTNPITSVEHGTISPMGCGKESLFIPTDFPQHKGVVPVGSILPWAGGYFTDGSNGGYTPVLGTTNDVAGANSYLNPGGYWVCNGTAPNQTTASVFNAASRYLPNLTDSRFLMGGVTAGGIGGSNTLIDHAHTYSLTAAGQTHTGNSASVSDPGNHAHTQSVSRYNAIAVCTVIGAGDTAQGSITASTAGAGSHTHTVSISHTHAASSVSGSVGSGSAPASTDNRPKFLSCFYIMRVL